MKEPKVSVIIPVYNGENFLNKCLDCVCSQSLKDIEILCINDGSTDSSPKILQEYAKKDKRIKVINQKNQGLSASRNNAIKMAKGKYLAFVDADDYVNKIFLEELYKAILKEKADVAVGNIIRIDNKKEDKLLVLKKEQIATKTDDIFRLFNIPKTCYVWNKLYERKFIINNSLFFKEGIYFEDIIWSSQVAQKAKKVVSVPTAEYIYVYNKDSIVATTETNPKKIKDRHDAHVFYNKFIKAHKIKAPIVWEKIIKVRFFGLPLIKIKENPEDRKEYYFCGIKFATIKISKHF